MNKGSILGYLIEIICSLLCILISIPIWNAIDIDEYYNIAKSYENYGVIDYSNIENE